MLHCTLPYLIEGFVFRNTDTAVSIQILRTLPCHTCIYVLNHLQYKYGLISET